MNTKNIFLILTITLLIFGILIKDDILTDSMGEPVKSCQDGKTGNSPFTKNPAIQWWYNLDAPSFGSASTDDIDGDGNLEIVFGTYFNDEHIYALNAENGTLLWKYNTGGCNDASPAIADVDQDGELEVIVPASSPYKIYCFNGETGQVEWSKSTGYPNCIDSPPAIADVDNDSKPEIIFGTFYGYVFCLNGEDGSICWQINLGADSYIQSGPNILDVDGDKDLDIVVAQFAGDCRIYALHGVNGSIIWFSDLPQDYMYHGGSFVDIDRDKKPEIIIGSYDHHIYVLNAENGSIDWVYQAPYYIGAPTSIADLNNDGYFEIVFSSGYMVGALSHNGSLIWDYYTGGSIFRGATIADIDNDEILDVCFGSEDGILRVLRGDNGQTIWIYDLEAHYGQLFEIDHAPIIADFDKNGEIDICVIGGYGISDPSENNHGRVYVITAGEGKGPGWPMFRHDLHHSGCYPSPSPTISNITVNPQTQFIGGFVNITCRVRDNVGITSVHINIQAPNQSWTNKTMLPTDIADIYFYNASYSLPGNYSFYVWASDEEGNVNISDILWFHVEELVFSANLSHGWNLVTVPVENAGGWTAESVGGNISGCTLVVMFDASSQVFVTHVVGTPWNDFPILDGLAYFVYVTANASMVTSGYFVSGVAVELFAGWNVVGWYHEYGSSAESVGGNISGCTLVVMFDASSQVFVTHVVGTLWNDFGVEKGLGMFVYTSYGSIWHGQG